LKEKFCSGYFDNLHKIHNYNLENLSQIPAPDLICEQLFLFQCAKNYKIKFLLGTEWDENADKKALEIGYCHLIADAKYIELPKVKERINALNPNLYEKILKTEKNI
jgi:hypothetical protein